MSPFYQRSGRVSYINLTKVIVFLSSTESIPLFGDAGASNYLIFIIHEPVPLLGDADTSHFFRSEMITLACASPIRISYLSFLRSIRFFLHVNCEDK
jgi:hypothetical protein